MENNNIVAQIRNLLYRGLQRAFCRLEIGDTAGWKPALRPLGAYEEFVAY
jgi:hypothetical protein